MYPWRVMRADAQKIGLGVGPQPTNATCRLASLGHSSLVPRPYTSLKTHTETHIDGQNSTMSDEEEMYESASDDYGSDLDMIDGTQESESGKASLILLLHLVSCFASTSPLN
jgi:hypothetical protein